MDYYRIQADDTNFADRWFLGDPFGLKGEELDSDDFMDGTEYGGSLPVRIPISSAGRTARFNFAALDLPVIEKGIVDIIAKYAPGEIERFPVDIVGSRSRYEIVNLLVKLACVDEHRTTIEWWTEEDGRPDKTGKYRGICDLTIDQNRTEGKHIFRIVDWETPVIVSDLLKSALEDASEIGIVYSKVT